MKLIMLPWDGTKLENEIKDENAKWIYYGIKKWSLGLSLEINMIYARMAWEILNFWCKTTYWQVFH
jgi:hypothetical protein